MDLTDRAVALAKTHLAHYGLSANVQQANAEALPFDDDAFDVVLSSGVLHHTPDTPRAFREAYRVLKPGGVAKITLYRLGPLHSRIVFPLTRAVMRWLAVKHPGADLSRTAGSVEDFVRQYDGADNPVGVAKKTKQWQQDLADAGFSVTGVENHFFPRRFLPSSALIRTSLHRLLDSAFGTMVYFRLQK